MATNCEQLVEAYADWLRSKFAVQDIGEACEITTPFLDRHNDRLQIYAIPEDGKIRLTDDGYIIGDLRSSGFSIDTPNRRHMLDVILNGLGVHEKEEELFVEAAMANFPQKKHALVQAMLAVNDMFVAAQPKVARLFIEDVSNFLEEEHVRFSSNVGFTGKTGFLHKFDFLIPKSDQRPERLIRALNKPTRNSATSLLFSWTDTREVRPVDARFYVFLNDEEKPPSPDLLDAFQQYDIHPIIWSDREEFAHELAT